MKLTENFNLEEFECNCGCVMPEFVKENVVKLADNLQTLRTVILKPIKITNAYRCKSHNAKVGGAKASQHLLGKAADLQVEGESPDSVADAIDDLMKAEVFDLGGLGRYNTFTHVDIRGAKARWNNKK